MRKAKPAECLPRIGIQFQGLLTALDGQIEAPSAPVNKALTESNVAKVWFETGGAFQLGVAFLVTAHHPQAHTKPEMGRGIARIQIEGAFEFVLRGNEVQMVMKYRPRQRSVGFCQAAVEFERFAR